MAKPSTRYILPKIDYSTIKRLWLVYNGTVYAVSAVPASVFRAAVLERCPKWEYHEVYGPVLSQATLDIHDRWFLLNCLLDLNCGVPLFASREQAERAVAEQTVGSHETI